MIDVQCIDYSNEQQTQQLLKLLQQYALDPMGGGEALNIDVQNKLISALSERSFMHSFICYLDGEPAGFANCIESFSTFNCKPVLNIHDFAVAPQFRGQGLSQALMHEIERYALAMGCCKITLEVLEGNSIAQNAYLKAGFKGYELDPQMGKAMFWEKKLTL